MCQNKQKLENRGWIFLVCLLCFVFCSLCFAYAKPLAVNIFLGDTHSKTAIDAVKAIENEYPQIKKNVDFNIYTSSNIMDKKDEYVDVFIFFTMGRQIIESVKPYLEKIVKNGGKVYGVGGIYDKEQEDIGIIDDETVIAYYKENGFENIKNMLLFVMNRDLGLDVSYKKPIPIPKFGIYIKQEKRIVERYNEFIDSYTQILNSKWIGLVFYKSSFDSNNLMSIDAVIESLEKAGFNVLPVYGYPSETAIERFFFDENGKSRLGFIVGMGMKMGINPKTMNPLLEKLNVPVINAITLYTQSENEWRKSPIGLNIFERAWQIAEPEMAGIIQPIVIASKEKMIDKETGIEYIQGQPIPERIKRLTDRIKAWINLQDKPNKDKRVAIIYYNYPPGKQNIGASYLNVLPESLWEILNRLKAEGYDIGSQEISKENLFNSVHNYARNIANWAQGELDKFVMNGKPILIPISTYKRWFEELPAGLKKAIISDWGEPEKSNIMTWTDANGIKYIVIPAVRYGNILLTPQPTRGWEQDVKKLYHSVTLAPHHQYVAFYLWLKKCFEADAVTHIGTHGTHEWLSGKEVGFTDCDSPEALIEDLPNIYPYIVDDVGEGLQAKRRGMAVIIDHMTPPFDKARLNKELKELAALISDYNVAKDKSLSLAESKIAEIYTLAKRIGLLTDLGLKTQGERLKAEDVEEMDDYIKDIMEKQTPFGLHTFGKSPDEKYRKTTAEAILSIEKGLSDQERKKKIADLEERIIQSGERELDSFVAALSGKYIPAGQGNDPIRNPNSLPTGKNFYSFDPMRIPDMSTYKMGAQLAKELIEGYKHRHGQYPDKLTFNLWGVETIRHEGAMESQIMSLMGIKPKWDARGKVVGVEAIPRNELERARIDVTIVPSGLYRDLFSNLMDLLDKAVSLAKEQDEEDNILRSNILKTKKMLIDNGISEDKAEKLASVRIFTVPSGAYGTNLSKVIPLSNTWDNEKQVADVYFMRMSYMYGQGFWGDKVNNQQSTEDISLTLFKNALSGTKVAIHSRSGNVYATLDNDDFFQYLGGTAMAIRAVDGKTPEVYVTNMSNPKMPKQEALEKFMGREMRTRYLNPEWIRAMMKEGYAGARFIDKVVEHLWGWQVTVPEAVDAAKWNEMYETYILDKNGLGIKDMFRQTKNMYAYQSVVARMIETVRKNYWKPDEKVVETLAKEYAESVKEVGLACCDHTCNNPLLTKFTSSVLMSVPGLNSQIPGFLKALDRMQKIEVRSQKLEVRRKAGDTISTAKFIRTIVPDGKGKKVQGYEMKEVTASGGASSAPIPWLFIIGFLVFIGLIAWGWRKKS